MIDDERGWGVPPLQTVRPFKNTAESSWLLYEVKQDNDGVRGRVDRWTTRVFACACCHWAI
jgi:hypothetical protein